MITVLYAGQESDWPIYEAALNTEFAKRGLKTNVVSGTDTPEAVNYLIYAPTGPITDLSPYTGLKLIQSLWAGVDRILPTLTSKAPLARMVDTGMKDGMVQYVVGNVLRHHLNTDQFAKAKAGSWVNQHAPRLAKNCSVGILGIGALGMACAEALSGLGFDTHGWSRTAKSNATVTCHSCDQGLQDILGLCDILVLLLPHTPDTENILNADSLAQMPKGSSIINPGRGPLIDDDALLTALNSGHISQATLDVFLVEPLPADSPYWSHPNVLVTPHVASETRVETAAELVADNIERGERGQPFLHVVDHQQGY